MTVAMEQYQVVSCPTTELSYTNRAILNPNAKLAQFQHIAIRYPRKGERLFEAYVFSVITDKAVPVGKIAFNVSGRKWASLMVNSIIEAAPYKFDPSSQCLNTISFTVDFANRASAPKGKELNSEDMAAQFSRQFTDQAFTVGQLFGFAFEYGNSKVVFELKVKELEAANLTGATIPPPEIGLTTANTLIVFERAEGSEVVLIGKRTGQQSAPRMFSQNWDLAAMGVGGLSDQFNKIFRRAFATRMLPPQLAKDTQTEHVKGIMLYGPPGTGKTLIARQIGKTLFAREPKIVNGPEVLNKFVGESEANIRKLFAEAEEEQAKSGIHSGLHIIIFDEIDAICKSRGASASSSGVGDNVVNQLLTKMDGVNSLDNVLLIGMTNRIDLIDEALLRPGRFELVIEIGLPNRDGRLEILKIHTKKLQEHDMLDASVDLEDLADRTRNYTGAELNGLIKAARSLALSRVVKAGEATEIDQELIKSIKLTRDDFQYAMDFDIKPALGASDDQLKELAKPVIYWDNKIGTVLEDLSGTIKEMSNPDFGNRRPFFALLIGEPGTGLTTLAANIALRSKFPFIRVYEFGLTSNLTENAKSLYFDKLFNDAARSELSCIVVDGLEYILDYSNFGPTFSKQMRTTFMAKGNLVLPEGHRMLVICTCNSAQFIGDLKISSIFSERHVIPSLTSSKHVLAALSELTETSGSTFTSHQQDELINTLDSLNFTLGIKRLGTLIEFARRHDSSDRVRMFLKRMHELDLIERQPRLNQPFQF